MASIGLSQSEISAIINNPVLFETLAATYLANKKGMYYGPLMLGLFADSLMLGIMMYQLVTWFSYSYSMETKVTKVLVIWLIVSNLACTGYTIAYSFHIFAYGFGIYNTILYNNYLPSYYILILLPMIPASIFFANRAYNLTEKSKIFALIQAVLLLSAIGAGITSCIIHPSTLLEQPKVVNAVIYLWLAAGVAVDILNTMTISVCLYRSRTGWTHTDQLIKRIIILTAETQLWPTICTILFLIFYIVPSTYSLIGFFVCVPKVYPISVLVVLNSRTKLRQEMADCSGTRTVNAHLLQLPVSQQVGKDEELTMDLNLQRTFPSSVQKDSYNRRKIATQLDSVPELRVDETEMAALPNYPTPPGLYVSADSLIDPTAESSASHYNVRLT